MTDTFDPTQYKLHLTAFREHLHPRDLMGRFQKKLDKLQVDWDPKGVELWATARSSGPKDDEFGVILEHIGTKTDVSGARGEGKASEALKQITDLADEAGVPVVLNVGDPDFIQKQEGGLPKSKLIAWYKRKGFKPNKGRNKDFAFTHTMIRQPRKDYWKTVPLYHATLHPYNARAIKANGFKRENAGANTGNRGLIGEGIYFKTDPDLAKNNLYGHELVEARADVSRLMDKEEFLRIADRMRYQPLANLEMEDESQGDNYFGPKWHFGPRHMREYLQSLGYDGVQWEHSPGDIEVVIFDPKKITIVPD